jgi:hypothetical protein
VTDFHESKIVPLIGTPNGVLTDFTTPSEFVAGSLRAIWNGQVYKPDDDKFGWTELSTTKIRFTNPPRAGDVMTCFYQELSAIPGISNVKGSPFHPNDSYP